MVGFKNAFVAVNPTGAIRSGRPGDRVRSSRHSSSVHALGDRDLAHVVAEARDPAVRPVEAGAGGARPGPDPRLDRRVAPVAGDDRALEPEAGGVGYVPFVNLVGRAEIIFFSVKKDESALAFWRWPWSVRWRTAPARHRRPRYRAPSR